MLIVICPTTYPLTMGSITQRLIELQSFNIGHSVQEEEDRAVAQLHSLTGRGGEQAFQARLQSGVQTVLTVCVEYITPLNCYE